MKHTARAQTTVSCALETPSREGESEGRTALGVGRDALEARPLLVLALVLPVSARRSSRGRPARRHLAAAPARLERGELALDARLDVVVVVVVVVVVIVRGRRGSGRHGGCRRRGSGRGGRVGGVGVCCGCGRAEGPFGVDVGLSGGDHLLDALGRVQAVCDLMKKRRRVSSSPRQLDEDLRAADAPRQGGRTSRRHSGTPCRGWW